MPKKRNSKPPEPSLDMTLRGLGDGEVTSLAIAMKDYVGGLVDAPIIRESSNPVVVKMLNRAHALMTLLDLASARKTTYHVVPIAAGTLPFHPLDRIAYLEDLCQRAFDLLDDGLADPAHATMRDLATLIRSKTITQE